MKIFFLFCYYAHVAAIPAILHSTTPMPKSKPIERQALRTAELISFVNSMYSDGGRAYARSAGLSQNSYRRQEERQTTMGLEDVAFWFGKMSSILRANEDSGEYLRKLKNSIRVHVIDNPEVLERFATKKKKKDPRRPSYETSVSEDDVTSSSEEAKYTALRRYVSNFGFREPEVESEETTENPEDFLERLIPKGDDNTEVSFQPSFPDDDEEKSFNDDIDADFKELEKTEEKATEKTDIIPVIIKSNEIDTTPEDVTQKDDIPEKEVSIIVEDTTQKNDFRSNKEPSDSYEPRKPKKDSWDRDKYDKRPNSYEEKSTKWTKNEKWSTKDDWNKRDDYNNDKPNRYRSSEKNKEDNWKEGMDWKEEHVKDKDRKDDYEKKPKKWDDDGNWNKNNPDEIKADTSQPKHWNKDKQWADKGYGWQKDGKWSKEHKGKSKESNIQKDNEWDLRDKKKKLVKNSESNENYKEKAKKRDDWDKRSEEYEKHRPDWDKKIEDDDEKKPSNKRDEYDKKDRENTKKDTDYNKNDRESNRDRDRDDDKYDKKDLNKKDSRNKKDDDWDKKDKYKDYRDERDNKKSREESRNKKDSHWNKKDNDWDKKNEDWKKEDNAWDKKDKERDNKRDDDWNDKRKEKDKRNDYNKKDDWDRKKDRDYDDRNKKTKDRDYNDKDYRDDSNKKRKDTSDDWNQKKKDRNERDPEKDRDYKDNSWNKKKDTDYHENDWGKKDKKDYSNKKKYDRDDEKDNSWNKKKSDDYQDKSWNRNKNNRDLDIDYKEEKPKRHDSAKDYIKKAKDVDNDWAKVGVDTTKKTEWGQYDNKKTLDSPEIKKKGHHNDYSAEKSEKKPKKTNDWDNYVPKIADYYKPKKIKRQDSFERPHNAHNLPPAFNAFGRTPIPFAGKKRIYAD